MITTVAERGIHPLVGRVRSRRVASNQVRSVKAGSGCVASRRDISKLAKGHPNSVPFFARAGTPAGHQRQCPRRVCAMERRDAGIIFYVASGAETLGEALTLFAYFRIVNEAVRLKLRRRPEGIDVEVDFIGVPRHSVRHNAEFGIAVIVKALANTDTPLLFAKAISSG